MTSCSHKKCAMLSTMLNKPTITVSRNTIIKKSNQGTLYAATDEAGNQFVVKISHSDAVHGLREIEILKTLRGIDGIPQYVDSWEEESGQEKSLQAEHDHYALAMTRIDGIDFEQRRAADPDHRLTCAETIDFIQQAGTILAAVHEHGVIHRDLKLSNFMVDAAGKIFIVDWASANFVTQPTNDVGHTPEGIVLGTVQFVSPEQITGQLLDQRTDIYSLGAVAALLRYGPWITQRYYYDDTDQVKERSKDEIAKAIAAHETLKYNRFPEAADQTEQNLQEVIKKMTTPNVERRYTSMRDVLQALAVNPSHMSS